MVGKTLGHYEILEPLGAGGMGEVYRARDTSLKREVAIKVLPEELSADPDRLARLEREAHLLAALNHPNIATIHALEEDHGTRFLVLELVHGESLEQRLTTGPLSLEKALELCKQIAEALEAAHNEGIIHRDLKPANILVTPEGRAKVLDFGLAKPTAATGGGSEVDMSHSPTLTVAGTHTGVILGTAPYMSPEQVRGQEVDKRADIWAFGCVLYESLVGRRAFRRDTVADTLAAIIEARPDWDALPTTTPALVVALLRRCLRKDPHRRLHDIADARIEIEEAGSEPSPISPPAPATVPGGWRWAMPLAFAAVAATVTGLTVWYWAAPSLPPAQEIRFDISAPDGHTIRRGNIAISPGGTYIAYPMSYGSGADSELYLRAVDGEPRKLPGTTGGISPVFSADESSILFQDGRTLKRISVQAGEPTDIAQLPGHTIGIDWADDGSIFAAVEGRGLMRLPASGEDFEVIVPPDTAAGEIDYQRPDVLPGGKAVLLDAYTFASADASPIIVYDVESETRQELIPDATHPRYVPGYIVFVRRNTLYAVPFDVQRLEVTGAEVPLLEGVYMSASTGAAGFDASQTGSLVYAAVGLGSSENQLGWVDRETAEFTRISDDRRRFRTPRISPDGRRLAVATGEGSILIYDLERGGDPQRFTSEGVNINPVWTPTGDRLTFSSTRSGRLNIYWQPADGSGEAEQLTRSDNQQYAQSWSPNGQVLAFEEIRPETDSDIMLLYLEGRSVEEQHVTSDREATPRFSPDGKWLAYHSGSGESEQLYVEPFPGPGPRSQVSTEGGDNPIWGRDGTLFFRDGRNFFSVVIGNVTGGVSPMRLTPQLMFTERRYNSAFTPSWDVSFDGTRFVQLRSEVVAPTTELHVVVNWIEELKQRVPTGRR